MQQHESAVFLEFGCAAEVAAMPGSHAGHGMRSGLLGHFAAFFSALFAGFRAFLAMRHFVLGAFFATGFTDRCAERGGLASMGGVACHELRRQGANVSTVAAQLDARHHGFDVLFIETASDAAFAGGGTGFGPQSLASLPGPAWDCAGCRHRR